MLLDDPPAGPAVGPPARTRSIVTAGAPKPSSSRSPRNPGKHAAHPNDTAQARVFTESLQGEITDLEDLILVAQGRWTTRRDAGWGAARTPEPALRLREKLREVQRLRDALQIRFGTEDG
ncbi:hypothetical protein ORI20_14350 [Mycobacterium sp. CVI_P3]|uniref:Uncharacterized protein n=1 Tax=Mycobacterium pinniadriaticum TaxID=2994102 RepID=A0ABT3SFI2_9MYCO|nr:hypothetical protein [Mycobacterium pinniadriaticum]MCX2931460.1 hypothetical protein [Mycobacterium pinniadriaticum]MCX2937884.1 hypothetical protein [Mycobacterium pinniadriaticum]